LDGNSGVEEFCADDSAMNLFVVESVRADVGKGTWFGGVAV